LIADVEPAALAAWRLDADRQPPFVLDVREPWEVALCRIEDSFAVPLQALPQALPELPRDRDIVVVCHHGVRSMHAAQWLARAGFARVHNLRGGIAAWADKVDPAMPRY
jgi:rhodanese-related sulfurtransferase